MRVFISWSGDASLEIAKALKTVLASMMQSVEFYMSEADNEAGTLWETVVASNLEESSFGILVLTPDNLDSRWLLFEAGALSKNSGSSRVVPLLAGVTTSQVKPPLTKFMMKQATRPGILGVIESINSSLEKPIPDDSLRTLYSALWGTLETAIKAAAASKSTPAVPARSDRDVLEEILGLVRPSRTVGTQSSMTPTRSLSTTKAMFKTVADNIRSEVPEAEVVIRGNLGQRLIKLRVADADHLDAVSEILDDARNNGIKVDARLISADEFDELKAQA